MSVLNANTDIVNNLSPKEIAERLAVAKERCQNEFGISTEKDLHWFFLLNFLCVFYNIILNQNCQNHNPQSKS